MQRWNRADCALAAAAVLFAACLALRLAHPGTVWIEALLFCSEAALVGGIADWFAVTALFKKPLGFPWHTALLSRRRAQLTASCVKLVQEEFFSKKKLIAHLKGIDFCALLLEAAKARREVLAGWVLQGLEDSAQRLDCKAAAAKLQGLLAARLQAVSPQAALRSAGRNLLAESGGAAYFDRLLAAARAALAAPAARETIRAQLEAYAAERTEGIVSSLLSLLAQRSNLINFDEAAAILQAHLLDYLDDLADPESFRRAEMLRILQESADAALQDETCSALAQDWLRALFAQFPSEADCEALLERSLCALLREAPAQQPTASLVGQKPLVQLLLTQIDALLERLREDAALQREIDAFLYDFAGRATLQAQEMAGAAVAEILGALDDEALSELLYKKVETDLLWIRMNGTIVGACIGLALFALLRLIG